jgi:hypothetical protein
MHSLEQRAKRNLKARYRTVGPKREKVTYTHCFIDENGALQQEPRTEEMECFYVFFPHGHSIRVTNRKTLEELGYNLKPRIVDMETGDVVDVGGDPYDFGNEGDMETVVLEEDIEEKPTKRRTADANA